MRVTFLLPSFEFSVGNRVAANYAKELAAKGHTVTMVGAVPWKPPLLKRLRSWLATRTDGVLRPYEYGYDFGDLAQVTIPAGAELDESMVPDADVVIATWWATAESCARFGPRKGRKVYFIQHHEVFPWLPRERVEATYRQPWRKIIAASWIFDAVRERYGDSDTHLLLNSVDTRHFFARPRGKQRTPTVGMLRENIEIKGEDVLLAAIEIARRQVPELQVIAFGPERPSRRHPMPDGTTFIHCPTVDEVRGIYAQCDAWLFASRAGTEGFGMPVLEAMACRTPVIGVPTGAASELLADGAGFLVPHDDPAAMAEAIVRVARMEQSEWQAVSEKAWQRAQEHRLKDAAEKFEKLLRLDVGV